jgi:2-hydroxychromene-2-carboxylate isomerase
MPAIRFYFDYLSPYAYLASTQIRTIAHAHGWTAEPIPVLFAALLDANRTRGPAEVPPKRFYVFKDVVRLASRLGVPLEPPATHPFNPLLALRATSTVDESEVRWKLVTALYRATWVEGRRVDQPQVVAHAAKEAGLDGAQLVEAAVSATAKARLRSQTQEAIDAGAFGVPTMMAEGELFWGVTRYRISNTF